MIGMKFVLNGEVDQDNNVFGWKEITLMSDLIPFRTIIREVDEEWCDLMNEPNAKAVHSHYHHVLALCDGEALEICWYEFSELLSMGLYVVAAAPELLECLKWAATFAEGTRDIPGSDLDNPRFNGWINDCNRAIAKAEGGAK